jgi:hypothetical protein
VLTPEAIFTLPAAAAVMAVRVVGREAEVLGAIQATAAMPTARDHQQEAAVVEVVVSRVQWRMKTLYT